MDILWAVWDFGLDVVVEFAFVGADTWRSHAQRESSPTSADKNKKRR